MFSNDLIASIQKWHLLKHPFYEAWTRGDLDLNSLKNYVVQYYPHVEAFPRFISAAHANCEDSQMRRFLAENLADEEGIVGGDPHPELWKCFGYGLGLSNESIVADEKKDWALRLRDGFLGLCKSSYAVGLGAITAYEYQVPEIAKVKIEGLKQHYGVVDDASLSFFRVHETADVFHQAALNQGLNRLDASEQKSALNGANEAGELLWNFLSECHGRA